MIPKTNGLFFIISFSMIILRKILVFLILLSFFSTKAQIYISQDVIFTVNEGAQIFESSTKQDSINTNPSPKRSKQVFKGDFAKTKMQNIKIKERSIVTKKADAKTDIQITYKKNTDFITIFIENLQSSEFINNYSQIQALIKNNTKISIPFVQNVKDDFYRNQLQSWSYKNSTVKFTRPPPHYILYT